MLSASDRAQLAAVCARRSAAAGVTEGYRLGPDDLVEVRVPDLLDAQAPVPASSQNGSLGRPAVAGAPTFQQGLRVDAGGNLTIATLGLVPVAGLTPGEAEREIAGRLVKAGILDAPQVSVLVVEYRSRVAAVMGSVERLRAPAGAGLGAVRGPAVGAAHVADGAAERALGCGRAGARAARDRVRWRARARSRVPVDLRAGAPRAVAAGGARAAHGRHPSGWWARAAAWWLGGRGALNPLRRSAAWSRSRTISDTRTTTGARSRRRGSTSWCGTCAQPSPTTLGYPRCCSRAASAAERRTPGATSTSSRWCRRESATRSSVTGWRPSRRSRPSSSCSDRPRLWFSSTRSWRAGFAATCWFSAKTKRSSAAPSRRSRFCSTVAGSPTGFRRSCPTSDPTASGYVASSKSSSGYWVC
ncbi:MAG: hypothetical protein FJ148_04890 [Deltaproteobacteria bacterium]|nr:hypothetical protein [Deltaproteobacteria bacterium]